jgi:hypothetical protein
VAVRLLPRAEKVVTDHLRAAPEVVALVSAGGGVRVGTELYAGSSPAVWVTLVTGEERFRNHLIAPQFDVRSYGGSKLDAELLARTVHAVMHDMPGSHAEGVVTDVSTLILPSWLPDDGFEPPRPRYVASYSVTMHPSPS